VSIVKTEKDLPVARRNAYLKALSALELGNHGLVVSLLGPLVAEEPEFLGGRKLLREAQVMRSRGKSSFLGLTGGGISLGRGKVKKLIESGDFHAALAEAEKALESDPTGAQPNKDLHEAAEAAAAVEREVVRPLQAEFDQAAPEAKEAAARKLDAAVDKLRTYEAIARFALETIALDAKNTKAKHELGDYLMRIEEYDEATKVFDEVAKKNRGDLDAVGKAKEAAARRSMQRGKLGTSSFADLVKQRQEASKAGGEKVVGAGESAEELARLVYEAHEAGNPDREAARKLADLYFNKEDYDNALEYYRYLSALANDTDPGLLRKISDTEVRRLVRLIGDKERELSAMAPEDETAVALRAELDELKRGKAEQMLGEARKRVERNPTDLQYRFELGEQLVLAGHYKEAIPELQKARSNPNTRTKALNMLGKCYTERNMLDLAAKTLTDAASEIPGMDGTKKDILYNLGLVYERMGNAEKSLECMKEIYEVDYGYLDVARRVEDSYGSSDPDADSEAAGGGVPKQPTPTNPPLAGPAAADLPSSNA
jgi:tetratricopeptide (TPR) repeat protein